MTDKLIPYDLTRLNPIPYHPYVMPARVRRATFGPSVFNEPEPPFQCDPDWSSFILFDNFVLTRGLFRPIAQDVADRLCPPQQVFITTEEWIEAATGDK